MVKDKIKEKIREIKEKHVEAYDSLGKQKEIYSLLCKKCRRKYLKLVPTAIFKKSFENRVDKFIEKLCSECSKKFK